MRCHEKTSTVDYAYQFPYKLSFVFTVSSNIPNNKCFLVIVVRLKNLALDYRVIDIEL